jgi:hypothetical protein
MELLGFNEFSEFFHFTKIDLKLSCDFKSKNSLAYGKHHYQYFKYSKCHLLNFSKFQIKFSFQVASFINTLMIKVFKQYPFTHRKKIFIDHFTAIEALAFLQVLLEFSKSHLLFKIRLFICIFPVLVSHYSFHYRLKN